MWKIPFCTVNIRFWQCEKGLLRRAWLTRMPSEVLCFRGVVWLLFCSLAFLHNCSKRQELWRDPSWRPSPAVCELPPRSCAPPHLDPPVMQPLPSPPRNPGPPRRRRRLQLSPQTESGSHGATPRPHLRYVEFQSYFFLLINVEDVKAYYRIRLDLCL